MQLARALTGTILVLTLMLLMLGGYVHSVGASLACPDWPLCYGQVFPTMQGGVLWEHSHRLLASAVGVLTLALVGATWRQPEVRARAVFGVVLVCFQGTLGGLTVIYRLPALISIAHLSCSMLFLAWGVFMFYRVRASAADLTAGTAPGGGAPLAAPRAGVALAAAMVYLQIVLGALVRHTQSSMSCGAEIFTCAGMWLPHDPRQALQTLHRLSALVAGALVIAGTLPAIRWARRNGRPTPRALAIGCHVLVLSQWAVGALVVKTAVHAHVVTLHLGLAALLWAGLVACVLSLGPLGVRRTRATGLAARPAAVVPATPVSDLHGAC